MQAEDDRKRGGRVWKGVSRKLEVERAEVCLEQLKVLVVDVFGMGDAPSSTAIESTA